MVLSDAVFANARLRMETPTPRVALGMALRGIASAAADISDGLLGDLGHILRRSGVGATIDTSVAINLIAACAHPAGATGLFDAPISPALALEYVLSGGDDYELVFTAPPSASAAVQAAALAADVAVTRIGQMDAARGLRLVDGLGAAVANTFGSFDHFA